MLGKPTMGFKDDNAHYIRNFGGSTHTKIMIGKPIGIKPTSYREALVSCPTPDREARKE